MTVHKKQIEPSHEIMTLFVLRNLNSLNVHAQPSSGSDFRSDPSSTSILHVCE